MPERTASHDWLDIELRELARHVALDPPDDLVGRVRARIDAEATGSGRPPTRGPIPPLRPLIRPLLAAAALLIAVLILAVPGARHAVAGLLGFRGERIERRQPSVTVTTAPPQDLGIGRRVTMAEARARLPELLVPTQPALGPPNRFLADPARPEVSLAYTAPDGSIATLISEVRGGAGPFFEKMLGNSALIEAVTVNGHRGVWISGPDHFLFYTDPQGRFVEDLGRVAGNALVWEQGSLMVRIEGHQSKEEALAVAASMR
jgi:hypothetical protein